MTDEHDDLDLGWAMPVDFAILAELPKQGSRLGYHQLAGTAKSVGEKLNDGVPEGGDVSKAVLTRRFVELHRHDLVVPVKVHGAAGARGWQITPRGVAALDRGQKEGLV